MPFLRYFTYILEEIVYASYVSEGNNIIGIFLGKLFDKTRLIHILVVHKKIDVTYIFS